MFSPSHVGAIAAARLCLGCGACAYICPQHRIRLVDMVEEGIRPVVDAGDCGSCRECLEVCPGYENDHTALQARPGIDPDLAPSCGPVLEIWEGHATDPEIRFRGASGGVITALSLFALEHESCHGVLHIGRDPAEPTRNRTVLSRTRSELLDRAGSRYAPASACDRLQLIEDAPGKCLFVGQPSEVTALRKAQRLRPRLDDQVALAVSFFCAGSPSRQGTLKLLEAMGIAPADVADLRYRGRGWPGNFAVTLKQPEQPTREMTYAESWGFVQAYRPLSTHLCPDGTGEDADISCGDPWYRPDRAGEPGSSLVVVRTEAGRRWIARARAAGCLQLRPAEPWKLRQSQKNLLAKRGAIGGRLAALRLLGLPTPRLRGFALFANWRALPLAAQVRSVIGTIRRSLARGYHRPLNPGLAAAVPSLAPELPAPRP
jgi:coenzyme F420 hydrogenase subunit beta